MKYPDGSDVLVGDIITIDGKYNGEVVANIDAGLYSKQCPKEHWSYLGKGAMVHTDFAGLMHYETFDNEPVLLVRRKT